MTSSTPSAEVLKPMNVMDSIRRLAGDGRGRSVEVRYSGLCDAVHHNLSAAAAVTSGSGVVDAARQHSGGTILGRGPITVTGYEYPVVWKADIAIAAIGASFVEDVRQTLAALEELPESPFNADFLLKTTGSPIGMAQIEPRDDGTLILPPARSNRPGRNEGVYLRQRPEVQALLRRASDRLSRWASRQSRRRLRRHAAEGKGKRRLTRHRLTGANLRPR